MSKKIDRLFSFFESLNKYNKKKGYRFYNIFTKTGQKKTNV